jgi:iron(III) transport system permease protein
MWRDFIYDRPCLCYAASRRWSVATGFIYASPAILVLGYVAQYAILPMRVVSASLGGVPRSLEEAARLSGAGWVMTLRYIVAPLAGRGIMAAWLIGYVFSLRDIAISIVVYPPGSDTLPIRILTLMANGTPSLIAALCIILIAITLLPLGVAGLWLKVGTSLRIIYIRSAGDGGVFKIELNIFAC